MIERAPDVERLFEGAYAAHQRGDGEAFAALVSSDPSTAAYGSDPAERNEGPDAFVEMLRANASGREDAPPLASVTDVIAYKEDDVAWLVAGIAFHRAPGDDLPFRGTGVLHREAGEWKMLQWTVSLLVPDTAMERAWPPLQRAP